MRRFYLLFLALCMVLPLTMLSACKENSLPEEDSLPDERIHVVCTIFPQYDWVSQLLGDARDKIELTLLLDDAIDLHSYQPSVEDIAKISSCDLFLYVGGESDNWVEDALATATNQDMIALSLLDILGDAAKEAEFPAGMEHEHSHGDSEAEDEEEHSHEDEEEHSHEGEEVHTHEGEFDEHVWLSLKHAQTLCTAIAEALSSLDPAHAELYADRLAAYHEKLSALDAEYQSAVDAASVKTLLFADRFPFRYLVDDYGLQYYAAFSGCSAETEASFETIAFLADKTEELRLGSILVTESADQSVAGTVRSHTAEKDQQILVLDSMQSVSGAQVADGLSYLAVMERNLTVLKEALR